MSTHPLNLLPWSEKVKSVWTKPRLRLFGSKTFSAFSDVWGAVKPWSTENVCSLTGKSLTKFRKTVYGKIFRKPFSKKFHASFVLRLPRSKPLFSPSMSFVSLAAIPLPSRLFLAVVMTGVTVICGWSGLRGGFRGGLRGGRGGFSAAQIRSQLPRSGLSSLSAVPDLVSALSLPSQIRSQLERRRRWDRAVGVWGGLLRWWWVFYVCFFFFILHCTKHCKIFSGLFS